MAGLIYLVDRSPPWNSPRSVPSAFASLRLAPQPSLRHPSMTDNESKVEAFLLLAKSARGLALVDLIGKCTAEPGLFTFGEILSLPGVQEVR